MDFFPGVREAVGSLHRHGFFVVVVTNQRCVAKGLISVAELESLHRRMRQEFEAAGATIDAIYYCPHENVPPCSCRKPRAGMLLQAAADHSIDLKASWMIGDRMADIEAGRAAGCHTALVGSEDDGETGGADLVAHSLQDVSRKILELEGFLLA
jgi:D-glycero-D-manno-heptose 1,7-bisphosphate phosphatase